MRLRKTRNGKIDYSADVAGDAGNFNSSVRFDLTGGYVGITQREDYDGCVERVLLTPEQVRALIRFVAVKHAKR